MAYVHVSVNKTSRDYLANERRYNYTTPKSFLEQIKLYQNLLTLKKKDLTTKMERLENGLEKLNNTTAQVRLMCLMKIRATLLMCIACFFIQSLFIDGLYTVTTIISKREMRIQQKISSNRASHP